MHFTRLSSIYNKLINFFTSGVKDNKLFIFESIVVIVMLKTLKKTKVYNFQSINTTLKWQYRLNCLQVWQLTLNVLSPWWFVYLSTVHMTQSFHTRSCFHRLGFVDFSIVPMTQSFHSRSLFQRLCSMEVCCKLRQLWVN